MNTVELHLSRLIETVSHQDVETIRIIGVFFENRLNWQIGVEKIPTNSDFRIMFIYLQIKHKYNSLYVFDDWRKTEVLKKCSIVAAKQCSLKGQADPDNWRSG